MRIELQSLPMSSIIKATVLHHLQAILDQKLQEAQASIATMQASLGNETKSTAGDKYETGRAMVQIELQKLADQRDKIDVQLQTLAKVDLQKASPKVEFGSLVETDKERYFVAIGLGKIEVDGGICYVISLDSPIGKTLQGKKAGDSLNFQGREIVVRSVS
jgi:transcription elongation GreA/GreB family factor